MKEVTISFPNGKTVRAPVGKAPIDFLTCFDEDPDTILAVFINNKLASLTSSIQVNCGLEPVLKGTRKGSEVYRQSLCFLLSSASHKLFPGARLLIGHSLGDSYYYTLEKNSPLSDDDIRALKDEMLSLAEQNLPITADTISYADACALFETLGLVETRKMLRYICPPSIKVNTMGGFTEMDYGPLASSSGGLRVFDLTRYAEGFLLRYPPWDRPDEVAPFADDSQLFSVYKQYKEWGRLVGVTSAASLNELIHNRGIKELIDITELLQQKHFAGIADSIAGRKTVRLVLMAGPSSSGKTTSSKKLALHLHALGYTPKLISLDSYYRGRDRTPRDAEGNYDYECLEALDVEQLGADLDALFRGRTIRLPEYDFISGKRSLGKTTLALADRDILIMEGIHGLNDKLTPGVPAEYKFKLYLSALTQLSLDDHNRVPASDNRLIRRIVRDSLFRGHSAAATIKSWANVQRGERLHIFPFQRNADAILNTALDYELPVLKVYADSLLRCVSPFEDEYAEASRLLSFLDHFLPIPAKNVPGQSIIREFIGGSDFKY
ncbi:MAG: nucleoside kinase [Spirochaetaceae bacterium]|jgi:uridine kinase|nr:nucleoside kinase [Spirochaetaceae bacterium]